jgi:lipoprotein NlpI
MCLSADVAACTSYIQSGDQIEKMVGLQQRDLNWYNKGDYDRAISDYNTELELLPNDERTHLYRGIAFAEKGDLDRAIADYNEAINKFEQPYSQMRIVDKALAYNKRGFAWSSKNELGRAITDLGEVIRLQPMNSSAYRYRGILHLYFGSLADARSDLTKANEIDPEDAYSIIWLDIVYRRSSLASPLQQVSSRLDWEKWPAPIVLMLLGERTKEAVLAAVDGPNLVVRKGRLCEGYFFAGQFALQQGDKNAALRFFRIASTDCPKNYVEFWTANAELKALSE